MSTAAILGIAQHEWLRLRSAMSFWLLLALTQLAVAWLTFAQLEAFAEIAARLKTANATVGVTDLVIVPTSHSLVLLLLLIGPLLAMGSLAAEARSGRMALWSSSPVSSATIATGKVLGLWFGLLPLIATASVSLGLLGLGVQLDAARFALAVAGLLLFSLWLACILVWLSGMFDHPAAALAASYGLLLILWLLDAFGAADSASRAWALMPHIEPMLRGLLRGEDLVYFCSTAIAAVLLTTHRLDRRRGLA